MLKRKYTSVIELMGVERTVEVTVPDDAEKDITIYISNPYNADNRWVFINRNDLADVSLLSDLLEYETVKVFKEVVTLLGDIARLGK